MFTLYWIGFCSMSKVAPIQCEQKFMFCSGAEIVPKVPQCEPEPYPSYNLQCFFLISKDHLPVRGSGAFSAPIKCSDLTQTVLKTNPIRNVPLSTAERNSTVPEQKLLRNCFESSVPSVNRSPIPVHFLLHSVSLSGTL